MVNFFLNKVNDAAYLLKEYVRITDGQSQHRSLIEYMAVLIMLSDIQVASDRHPLAKKILATAKDFYNRDDNDGDSKTKQIAEELRNMIDLRLCLPMPSSPATPANDGQEGGEPLLEHDPDELKVFQSIPLKDD